MGHNLLKCSFEMRSERKSRCYRSFRVTTDSSADGIARTISFLYGNIQIDAYFGALLPVRRTRTAYDKFEESSLRYNKGIPQNYLYYVASMATSCIHFNADCTEVHNSLPGGSLKMRNGMYSGSLIVFCSDRTSSPVNNTDTISTTSKGDVALEKVALIVLINIDGSVNDDI